MTGRAESAIYRCIAPRAGSLIHALSARGFKAVDTDDGWCEPLPDGRQRWREDAIGWGTRRFKLSQGAKLAQAVAYASRISTVSDVTPGSPGMGDSLLRAFLRRRR